MQWTSVPLPLGQYVLSLEIFVSDILSGVRWNLSIILICISLRTKDFEHFFKCFLDIRDSSVENSLFSSVPHYLIRLFGLLESNFLSSLCNLDISPLSDVRLWKIFHQFVGCHFVLLPVSFTLQKPFSFKRCHLSIVDLRAWAIGDLFRKFSPVPMGSRLSLTFSSIRFSISSFVLQSLIWAFFRVINMDQFAFFYLHTAI